MKNQNKKAFFLSIFLMLPLPIFTSEIVELYDKRNSPNYLKNNSQNTTLKLNPKKDNTELIITNIGINSKIKSKILDKNFLLEIEPESKINLSSEFQSISLPKYGVKTATLKKIDNKIVLKVLPQENLNIENINIKKNDKDILLSIPKADPIPATKINLFKKPLKIVDKNNNLPKKRASAPPLGDIAVGTNFIPNPNLIEIEGPEITIVFRKTPAKEALEYLISKTSYDYVWVNADPSFKAGLNRSTSKIDDPRLISLNIKNLEFAKAFNAILMASGLQAKLEGRIVYIGPNVRDTIFSERISKIYRLNQTSANSAASYLANLGAKVTKISTISTAIDMTIS